LQTASRIIAQVATRVESPLAVVVHEPGRVPLCILVDGTPVEVGRECDGLLLADPTISRRHLSLQAVGGALRVTDLGSRHGTRVGIAPLDGPHELKPHETVRFGRSTVELWSRPTGSSSAVAHGAASTIDQLEAIVSADPPDLAGLSGAATTVTTVVLGIHDGERTFADMGSDRWSAVVEAHASIVRRHCVRTRGLELVCCGDAFLLAFVSAFQAVTCAIDVQRAAHALARSRPADAVQARLGAHTSDAVVRADPHLFGHHVSVTAALARAARGGEILVTGIVRELIELHGAAEFDAPRHLSNHSSRDAHLAHPLRGAPRPTSSRP
jgi:class 3 adenylate cyclase